MPKTHEDGFGRAYKRIAALICLLLSMLGLGLLASRAFREGDRTGLVPGPGPGAEIAHGEDRFPMPASRVRTSGSRPLLGDGSLVMTRGSQAQAEVPAGSLTIELRGPGAELLEGYPIEVEYRLRSGAYGTDQGRTDSAGQFSTSTQHPLEIESLLVRGESPTPFRLQGGSLAVSPERPGVLVIELPRMRSIQVRIDPPMQPSGEPWAVWAEPVQQVSADPFVCRLASAEYGGFYATEGELTLAVSEGWYSVYLSESTTTAAEVLVDEDPTLVELSVEAAPPEREPPPEIRSLLRGRVLAADSGAGLRARVRPMAELGAPDRFGSWSEPNGRFACQASSRIRYVAAAAEGYAFGILGPLDPGEARDLEIRLLPAASITGRVVDSEGEAITSGRVRLFRSSSQLGQPGEVPGEPAPLSLSLDGTELTPQDSGYFTFGSVTAEPLGLVYEPYDPSLAGGSLRARGGESDLILVAGESAWSGGGERARLDIEVVDAQAGVPIHGACLALTREPVPLYRSRRPEVAFSNAQGAAVLFGSPGQPTWLSAWMTPRAELTYVARRIDCGLLGAGSNPIRIELERATGVFLCLRRADGSALAGATLSAESRSGEPILLQTMIGEPEWSARVTDHNGRSDLRGVPESGFMLLVEPPPTGARAQRPPARLRVFLEPSKISGRLHTVTLPE